MKDIANQYATFVLPFKFRAVKQHETETINTFYHRILRLARQCQFENINEHLIDAIVYGCKAKKAQDKLLQMPIQMTLEECLLICRHYESLQWHINTVRPTGEIRAMDGLARQCQKSKSRSNSNTRRPQQSPAVHPDKPRAECTTCGTLHQVGECPAASSVCFKCNKQGHFSKLCRSTTSTPSSNRNTRGSWHGRGRGNRSNRGHGSKHAAYEAEMSDTSKPIVDATNSEIDVVKLLQAYGIVPTEGSELKHRTKKVATDEISMMPIQMLGDNFTLKSKPLVLRGSPVECNVDIQWKSCEDIVPIISYITTHAVPMEIANPLDWSFDVHLIEIDDIHTDVVYSNIELNRIVLKAKQDTGAQINVLSRLYKRMVVNCHCTLRLVSCWSDMEIKL